MKTLSDVMKTPYMSLIAMRDDRFEELLEFGPYLISNMGFENSRHELSYTKIPLLKYLLDMMALVRLEADETATFKGKKEFLLQMMRDTSSLMIYADVYNGGYTNWCATRANQYAESALNKLRNIQYRDTCVESAMTGYAPIVPYGIPMMKLPLLNKKSEDLEDEIEYKINAKEALESILPPNIGMQELSDLREIAIRLLIDYGPVILKFSEYTIDPKGLQMPEQADGAATFTLPTWTQQLLSGERDLSATGVYAMAYYLIAFVHYARFSLSVGLDCSNLDTLLQKAREIADGAVPTFESLMELSDIFSTPETINDIFSTPTKLSKKFEEDKEKEKVITPLDKRNESEQEKEFDADILVGYIYTHRRYKQDKYTNQAFLAQYEDIKDYSYMQDDIMICTIKENYLCSPAIDLAGTNNYQLVLICLDKDDRVFVVRTPDDLV